MEIEKAKHQIEVTIIATDHRLIRDKWLNIKRIIDAIYKQVSPLINSQQTISINNDSLTTEQKRLFSSVLEKMWEDNIIDYHNYKTPNIATSEPIRKFLKGEDIIVENRNTFENYRKEISEFYDFIEKDGRKRFPETYKKTFDKTESVKQFIEEVVDNLNYSNYSDKLCTIEQKFKMIVRKYFDNNVANNYLEDFKRINFYSLEYAIVDEDLYKSNFDNNKKKLLGLLNIILNELNLEKNMQDKKENINVEHSQENTKNNTLVETIYNNGHLQTNSDDDNNTKNSFFWHFIVPLVVLILGSVIVKIVIDLLTANLLI